MPGVVHISDPGTGSRPFVPDENRSMMRSDQRQWNHEQQEAR